MSLNRDFVFFYIHGFNYDGDHLSFFLLQFFFHLLYWFNFQTRLSFCFDAVAAIEPPTGVSVQWEPSHRVQIPFQVDWDVKRESKLNWINLIASRLHTFRLQSIRLGTPSSSSSASSCFLRMTSKQQINISFAF